MLGKEMKRACVEETEFIAAVEGILFVIAVIQRMIPDGGVSYLLPRLVGLKKAKEMVFFGDDLSAADAEGLGLVNLVVPGEQLEATTREWAKRLASGPTRSIGFAKRLLNRSLDADRGTSFVEEQWFVELGGGTADQQEGVAAFIERRPPEFKGY